MALCTRLRMLHVHRQESILIAGMANIRPCFLKSCVLQGHQHVCMLQANRKLAKHCAFDRTKNSNIFGRERLAQEIHSCISRSRNQLQSSRILSSGSNAHSVLSELRYTYCIYSHLVRRMYSTTAPLSFSSGTDKTSQPQIQLDLDLELESRLSPQNLDNLRKNLSARGSGFDLDQLLADYKHWKELDDLKTTLERERTIVAKTMASLVKGKAPKESSAEKETLTQRGKAIKEEMKAVMPSWLIAEQTMMRQAVQLPADLHPLTPHMEDQHVQVWKGTVTDPGRVSHVQFGEQRGLLKFSSVGPRAVYLQGKAAELEQSLLHSAATCLTHRGYSPLASPEMFRAVVVEGCGLEQEEVLSLEAKEEERETNAYYLKGTSLLSYAAFLTRMQLRKECLPLKMYSVGRHYRPPRGDDRPGLYGPVQSSRVTMFSTTQSQEETTAIHDDMLTAAWEMAQGLGLPARKTLVSASKLAPSESLRSEVQIWAPGLQQYVPMACVSIHNDYASRRLMSRAFNGHPLHMVSGVAMDAAVAVASILEHTCTQGDSRLPSRPDLQGGGGAGRQA